MAAVTTVIRVATAAMLLRRGLRPRGLRRRARRLGLGASGLCLGASNLRLSLYLRAGGLRLRTRLGFSLAACLLLRLSAGGLCLRAGVRLGLTARLSLRLTGRLCANPRGGLGGTRLFAGAGQCLGAGGIGLRTLCLTRLHLRTLRVAGLRLRLLPLDIVLLRQGDLSLPGSRLACGTIGLHARHLARALLIALRPRLLLSLRLLLLTLGGLRLGGGLTLLAEIARPVRLLACRL
jgi:hypothetical protein